MSANILPIIKNATGSQRMTRGRGLCSGSWLTGLALMTAAAAASGQEALKTSLAQESISQSRLQDWDNQPSTLSLGDLKLLATASLSLDYNDNIYLSKSAQSDWVLRPNLNLKGLYPVTENNILELGVGIGYNKYFKHDSQSGMQVDGNSGTSFNFQIKDFEFNLHERFSYSRDAASQSQLANVSGFDNFNNTVGMLTTWNLGDVIPSLGYDHVNSITSGQNLTSRDRTSEMVVGRTGIRIHPELVTGIEASANFTSYDKKVLNDSTSYTIGGYFTWKPSTHFGLTPRAGYSIYSFDQTSRSVRTADIDSWYADLGINHRITETLTYNLNVGRETQVGLQSDVVQDWYVRPSISWSGLYKISTSVIFSYEKATQGVGNRGGNLSEKYDYYTAGVDFGYPITQDMTASINYRITARSSDLASRGYTQNIVGARVSYQF